MKKLMSKITAIISAVFGLVFIILLITTAFGGLTSADFDNRLVKVLLFVFGGCYVLTAVATIAFMFNERVTIKEVQVSHGGLGNIKVTPAVIKTLIKKNLKNLPGLSFNGMQLYMTEFGIQLAVAIKCSDGRRAEEAGVFVQALVADLCKKELDLEFHTINVKVSGFKSNYEPDVNAIEAQAKEASKSTKHTAVAIVNEETEAKEEEAGVALDASEAKKAEAEAIAKESEIDNE